MTAWDAIWPLLSRVDPALIQQHWPTSEPRSFLQMLHAYDPTQAQRLERTYQLVQRFQHVPMVAVAGLINSGKSALVASFLSGASRARVLRGRQSSQGSQRFCLWLPRQWQADQVFYDDLLTMLEEVFGVCPELLVEETATAHLQQNDAERFDVPLMAFDPNLDDLGIALLDCPDVQRSQHYNDTVNRRLDLVAQAAELCAAMILVIPRTQIEVRELHHLLDRMPNAQRIYAINMLRQEPAAAMLSDIREHLDLSDGVLCYAAYDFELSSYEDFTPVWDGNRQLALDDREQSGLPCWFEVYPQDPDNAPEAVSRERSLLHLPQRLPPEALQRQRQLHLQRELCQCIETALADLRAHIDCTNEAIETAVIGLWQVCHELMHENGDLRIKMDRHIVQSLEQSLERTASWHDKLILVPQRRFLSLCSKGVDGVKQLWQRKDQLQHLLDPSVPRTDAKTLSIEEIQRMLSRWSGESLDQYLKTEHWQHAAQHISERLRTEETTNLSQAEWDDLTRQLWQAVPVKARAKVFGSLFLMLGSMGLALHVVGYAFVTLKTAELLGGIGVLTSLRVNFTGVNDFQKALEDKLGLQQLVNFHSMCCDELGLPREELAQPNLPMPTIRKHVNPDAYGIRDQAWTQCTWNASLFARLQHDLKQMKRQL